MNNNFFNHYHLIRFADLPATCFHSEEARKIEGTLYYNPALHSPFEHLKINYLGTHPEHYKDNCIILGSSLFLTIEFSGSSQFFQFGESGSGFWTMRPFGPCKAVIGNNVTSNGVDCFLNPNSTLEIGDDCMFSLCHIHAGDSHAMIDLTSEEVTNANHQPSISIGEHVWVALGATILANSTISAGSIIGTRALVKGTFPPCCLLAGIPAKIKREHVSWSRSPFAEDKSEIKKYLQGIKAYPEEVNY